MSNKTTLYVLMLSIPTKDIDTCLAKHKLIDWFTIFMHDRHLGVNDNVYFYTDASVEWMMQQFYQIIDNNFLFALITLSPEVHRTNSRALQKFISDFHKSQGHIYKQDPMEEGK